MPLFDLSPDRRDIFVNVDPLGWAKLIGDEVKRMQDLIRRDEHLFTELLDAWDHSDGGVTPALIERVRQRMERV